MRADELRPYFHAEPFQPFWVHLKDGRKFEIFDPNLALLGEGVVDIGIPPADDPRSVFADRNEWIPLDLVDRIELISVPVAG